MGNIIWNLRLNAALDVNNDYGKVLVRPAAIIY